MDMFSPQDHTFLLLHIPSYFLWENRIGKHLMICIERCTLISVEPVTAFLKGLLLFPK